MEGVRHASNIKKITYLINVVDIIIVIDIIIVVVIIIIAIIIVVDVIIVVNIIIVVDRALHLHVCRLKRGGGVCKWWRKGLYYAYGGGRGCIMQNGTAIEKWSSATNVPTVMVTMQPMAAK